MVSLTNDQLSDVRFVAVLLMCIGISPRVTALVFGAMLLWHTYHLG